MMNLSEFASFLTSIAVTDSLETATMEKVGQLVETESKRVIGTYDYGWPQLSEYTLARKEANTPLLETGEMRESIGHTTMGNETSIGSNEDKALWQELGTAKIPPRSFLQGAAVHKEEEIIKLIGESFHQYLIGGR